MSQSSRIKRKRNNDGEIICKTESVLQSSTDSQRKLHIKGSASSIVVEKEKGLNEVGFNVPFKNKEIPSVLSYVGCSFEDRIWIVLTHGASGDLNTPQLKALSSFLASQNYVVVRFTCKGLNIKYRINVFEEMLSYVLKKYYPQMIFIGGRSMGARAAAMLMSDGTCKSQVLNAVKGVICLSYPLHKVGDDRELRKEPLINAKKPIFFLSGSDDGMCEKSKLEEILKNMKTPYSVQWLNGYDHSAKSNQNFNENDYMNAFEKLLKWCQCVEKTNP